MYKSFKSRLLYLTTDYIFDMLADSQSKVLIDRINPSLSIFEKVHSK